MDNISDLLGALSPDDMEKVKSLAKDLFSDDGEAPEGGFSLPEGFNPAALGALLGGSEDERSRLIKALKPMLSEERQRRADNALRFLKLAAALPALKESGLLDGFLEGLDE